MILPSTARTNRGDRVTHRPEGTNRDASPYTLDVAQNSCAPEHPQPRRTALRCGVPEASVTLPGDASSVPAARRFVTSTLEAWGYDDISWTAQQIVSELAGNCALHARTEYSIRLVDGADGLRLEVQDQSKARVQPRRYSRESTTGRGLRLVEHLADAWGVEPATDGKTVWVTLRSGRAGTSGDEEDVDLDVDALLAAFDDDDDDGRATASHTQTVVLRWAA